MLGVDHFSLEILTKIGCNFGKDFKGKVVDLLHPRSDHQKIFFVIDSKKYSNYPQGYMLVVGTSEWPQEVSYEIEPSPLSTPLK